MLKGSTRILFSRILGLNKFHKTPVIMTQLEKDNLVAALQKPIFGEKCRFNLDIEGRGDHLPEDSLVKYHIVLTPRHNAIKNLDRIVYAVKSVSNILCITLEAVDGGRIVIL